MSNPLLADFNTPFDTPPFQEIKLEHYLPAIEAAMKEAKDGIKTIKENSEEATFENTVEAMAYNGKKLSVITSVFFNLNSAETSEEMQKLAQEISPKLSAFSNDISLDADLFKRIQEAKDNTDTSRLSEEQKTLLEKTWKGFVRNGANLNEEDKNKIRAIDEELSKLKLTFGENVLAETNAYTLHITDEADLKGLPENAVEAAAEKAKELEKEGWVFGLDFPSYYPFMMYAENRDLREKMYRAYTSRALNDGDRDNKVIVKRIVNLRHQRAQILGYDSHAHFVLEERMAENPTKVISFLEEIKKYAKPAADKELDDLKAFANDKDKIESLQRWDITYYSEMLKKERFEVNDEITKPYFALEHVVKGIFEVAGRLFNLTFEKRDDIQTYHKDVQAYEVKDGDKHIAVFYADFFPRPGKRDGAWMTSFRNQYKTKDGVDVRPHVSIVCNFTKPTSTTPSLLSFREVTTLFHEFGHALHGMLADSTYSGLSGTNVYWDFVELPSQLLENWAYEKECLDLFAEHYKTGELIPMDIVERIRKSANFMEGVATLRQLSFGILDMKYHGEDPSGIDDVIAFERDTLKDVNYLPEVENSAVSTSFSHIFQGGYSSGYYSYKWAEVLDADAFEFFKENGIFDSETAQKYRKNILSAGGSEHPSILYKRFRGREPQVEALLKRAGLIEK